jgi:hypothetical protein
MIAKLNTIALLTLLCALVGTPLRAQTTDKPDARFVRTLVETIPIGATVKLRTRAGERLTAVLWLADDVGIRVKPATRVPERSRSIPYDEIDRIERYQDHVSVGKYVGTGAAIGAATLWLLLAGF